MTQLLLQDFISACLELSREEFCARYPNPLLIQERQGSGLVFTRQSTRLSKADRSLPLGKDLIRQANQCPVLAIEKRLPGPADRIAVGRSSGNDVVLTDETISARHAAFRRCGSTQSWSVVDLASSNGSKVNSSPLEPEQDELLFDGDVLVFGDSVFLFFYPLGLYDVLRASPS